MIRDDFKDVKQVTSKESRKKRTMGERNFYASSMSKLRDMNKALGFSVKFTIILMSIAYALILTMFIMSQFYPDVKYPLTSFIVWSCIYGALLIFTILWYAVIKPNNLKKIEKYKRELEALSAKDLGKISAAYSIYGEKYKQAVVDKHKADSEKARAAAKEAAEAQTAGTDVNTAEAEETAQETSENDKNIDEAE